MLKSFKTEINPTEEQKVRIRYWVKTEDYWESRWRVLEEIKEEFDNNNIAIPFEQLDVNLIPQEKE